MKFPGKDTKTLNANSCPKTSGQLFYKFIDPGFIE
jgi:hypothetical protein